MIIWPYRYSLWGIFIFASVFNGDQLRNKRIFSYSRKLFSFSVNLFKRCCAQKAKWKSQKLFTFVKWRKSIICKNNREAPRCSSTQAYTRHCKPRALSPLYFSVPLTDGLFVNLISDSAISSDADNFLSIYSRNL